MEWTIEYLANECLLYIKTKGVVTRERANLMVGDIVEAMERYKCIRQIVDHRLSTFAFQVREYYERPEVNKQIGISTRWKIAMVFNELTKDTFFMETVFRNRGYDFRQFCDLEEARAWVLTP
ncbi:MAG: hypothetical protein IPG80_07925 [Anaerolineales bacterium]|jgi:hypothetical protein|uniref:hypothetical protein n=1 Tax=Candidatus Villigracilis vicinus TaxID=3140679 RepID=UPI0031372376|nr:hypothetical protein [Anaerolineales bacterium]MBK9780102.1 hypothetical protein [Anaerolineales bacterium]